MKHTLKSILAMLLALLMLAGFAACGKGGDVDSTFDEGSYRPVKDVETSWDVTKNVDENFDLEQYIADEHEKWYLGYDAELSCWTPFSWKTCNRSFSNYSALDTVKQITGIDMTCDVALSDASEALYLMMTTGNWPDLICFDGANPIVNELIEGGYVYSLTELAEEYDPDFFSSLPASMVEAGKIAGDDTVWGIVSDIAPEWKYEGGTVNGNLGNQGYLVRHDIWEALGEPSIATPDDLYNTLKLFKETYPSLDNKESIPLGGYGNGGDGTLLTIGYSFGLKQDISIDYSDNSVTLRFLDPNFEEFAVFMNKLYREGLLDPEFFVKNAQQSTEGATSNVFMMPWVYHALDEANAILRQKDPNSAFVAIPPMSATGSDFSYRGSSRMTGSSICLITKKCADPAAALRIMRYGASPAGSLQMYKGNPGRHYIVTDGVMYQSDEVYEAAQSGAWAEWNLTEGVGDYYWFYYSPIEEGLRTYPLREEFDLVNTYPYSYDGTNELFNMAVNTTTDAGIAFTYANQIGWTEQARAITAASEAECRQIVQQMQADIRNVPNLDKLEEFWTTQYRANIEKFGTGEWGNPNPNG